MQALILEQQEGKTVASVQTIDPDRLQQIRQERRPNSRYANLETCRREVAAAETMFRMERIPTLSTTHTSIEEISSKVLGTLGLQREMY